MTRVLFGRDEAELRGKLDGASVVELRERGFLVGGPVDLIEQLRELERAGVQRVMLQWLDLDALDALDALARDVLPHV